MTLYEILEVPEDATIDKIRQAYKHLATKYHPDKHNNDPFFEKKFKELNEAHSTLSDPDKRKDYDAKLKNSKYRESNNSYSVYDDLLKKEKEQDQKAKSILYASEEIVISKLYINIAGSSYLIDEIDAVVVKRNESKRNTWAWFFLVTGISTLIIGVGILLLMISIILFLLPKEYLLILINRNGSIPVLTGVKKDLLKIKDIIDNEIRTQHKSS